IPFPEPMLIFAAPSDDYGPTAFCFTFSLWIVAKSANDGRICVNVLQLNQAPYSNSFDVYVPSQASVVITISGADPDNGPLPLIARIFSLPTFGELRQFDNSSVYPVPNNVTDSKMRLRYYAAPNKPSYEQAFTFRMFDGTLFSALYSVHLYVGAPNSP